MSDKIIAVTGHQCEKISDRYGLEQLFQRTFLEVEPKQVIVGMACGSDLLGGLAAIKASFPVVAVIPWAGHQESKYITECEQCQEHYQFVRHFSREVIVLNDAQEYPGPQAFHARNHYMVDNATHVLAFYDGGVRSGTAATVKYATDTGKPIRNIYDRLV